MNMSRVLCGVLVIVALGWAAPVRAEDDEAKKAEAAKEMALGTQDQPIDPKVHAKRQPDVYLTTFINGYANDGLPKDNAQFEKLLVAIRDKANFSAILCRYSDERLALCKKHKVRMFVDLLSFPHIYRNPLECKALLKKLRGDPTVAAYHLWSDRFGGQGKGRTRDINNCHRWDPTHACLSGTYSGRSLGYLARADFVSNYNFSWKRGPHKNFRDLIAGWKVAQKHNSRQGRYLTTDAGLPGRGNPNRLLYVQTTSIAFGLRAGLWHIGSRIMNMGNFQLNQYGKDIAKVNAWTKPLWYEIPKMGLPTAVYSTKWTKDWNNRDVSSPYPPYLDKYPFPGNFWIQPQSGEFVMTMGKYEGKTDYAFLANHNAYGPQDVALKFTKSVRPQIFNREKGKYEPLRLKGGVGSFKLDPAGGALILFK